MITACEIEGKYLSFCFPLGKRMSLFDENYEIHLSIVRLDAQCQTTIKFTGRSSFNMHILPCLTRGGSDMKKKPDGHTNTNTNTHVYLAHHFRTHASIKLIVYLEFISKG